VTEAIIVALITAASAVVCQLVIASNSRKTMQQAQYDSQKLIEYKIDKLSERVDPLLLGLTSWNRIMRWSLNR